MARPRLCVVTAATMSLEAFWRPLLRRAEQHFDLTVIADAATPELVDRLGVRAAPIAVPIARRPAPFRDLLAQRRLRRIFTDQRFDIVHSQTPKAGWLAMRAARTAGVPVRVHTFTGQVWATARGPWRRLLRRIDAATAAAATTLLADSRSQAEFLSHEGLAPRAATAQRDGAAPGGRIRVLGSGSISGVDANRFRPDPESRRVVRAELGAAPDDPVLLFVGRLSREKGVPELLRAFGALAATRPALRLWLIGPDEGAASLLHSIDPVVRRRISATGLTRTPERFMAGADLLLLPSHREGFGSTVIEAAACGIPAIASRIYGLTDAIVDGDTGLLHAVGDSEELARQIARMLDDAGLRRSLGDRARARAVAEFDPDRIAAELVALYHAELERLGAGARR